MPIAECHITKVSQELGSEWGRIETDHDTVRKLSTKRPDLISEAAAFKASGVLVGIDYNERVQTKPAADGSGLRTYRDFYYNGAGELAGNGSGPAEIPGLDIVQPQARGEDPDRNWRICLQTGAKLAVATMPLMPVDQRDFETQKAIARAWGEFFLFEPRPTGTSSPDELDDIPY